MRPPLWGTSDSPEAPDFLCPPASSVWNPSPWSRRVPLLPSRICYRATSSRKPPLSCISPPSPLPDAWVRSPGRSLQAAMPGSALLTKKFLVSVTALSFRPLPPLSPSPGFGLGLHVEHSGASIPPELSPARSGALTFQQGLRSHPSCLISPQSAAVGVPSSALWVW